MSIDMLQATLIYTMRIGVIPKCDKGNAKPFEATNERLGVSGRLVSWGAFHPPHRV